ncbi:AI-2E family transporter [uncultured Turicimonas sp.]|uniref:AI-2E family transporter n=1 Tax=uncultured Turicimonas sp. TaxID=1918607 RepID=UPI0028041487|nr:AI-2E family transporter [uncultured Turicimonas sp.]
MADNKIENSNLPKLVGFLSFKDRVDVIVRVLFGFFIAIGCFLVVWPFATAISVAAVIAIVSWPLFKMIRKRCGNRNLLASFILVFLLTVLIVIPITGLSVVSAQQIPNLISMVREWIASGFSLPNEIKDIPWVGNWLYGQLDSFIGNREDLAATAQKLFDPVSKILLKGAVMLGDGLFQLFLMIFIIFFFYRDGDYLADKSLALLTRMSGNLAVEVRNIIVNTTRSVVFGIVGSAAGQGIVAFIGFLIAGVPGAVTLGVAVFVLSAVPIGPPLVWGPAAIWLYYQGQVGMAVFLVLWGSLAVSSVDNFLKPLLISKGASLPLSLIYLGVFGGIIAFGFMGIILGPVVIAVGIAMSKTWLSISASVNAQNQPTEETEKILDKLSQNSINDSNSMDDEILDGEIEKPKQAKK